MMIEQLTLIIFRLFGQVRLQSLTWLFLETWIEIGVPWLNNSLGAFIKMPIRMENWTT